MPAWWTSLDVWFCDKSGQFSTWDHVCLVDLTCGAAWSVCWLQDETGDVNRFSHSQWVSEQGCNACMMDLLRCLILREEWPIFYLRPCLFGWLDSVVLLGGVCWLQDETGDVNRFSHSQWVSEQGCNACMMDLLRCLILRQKRPIFQHICLVLLGWLDMPCCLDPVWLVSQLQSLQRQVQQILGSECELGISGISSGPVSVDGIPIITFVFFFFRQNIIFVNWNC